VRLVHYRWECPVPECLEFGYEDERREACSALAEHMGSLHPEILEGE
jgi:hypothetical protein